MQPGCRCDIGRQARPTGHNSSSVETQTRCSNPLLPRCTFAIYPSSISRHCARTVGPRREAADPVPSPALELDDIRWFTLPLRPFSHFRFRLLAQSSIWSGRLASRHARNVSTRNIRATGGDFGYNLKLYTGPCRCNRSLAILCRFSGY
jgi:hypothetical protein